MDSKPADLLILHLFSIVNVSRVTPLRVWSLVIVRHFKRLGKDNDSLRTLQQTRPSPSRPGCSSLALFTGVSETNFDMFRTEDYWSNEATLWRWLVDVADLLVDSLKDVRRLAHTTPSLTVGAFDLDMPPYQMSHQEWTGVDIWDCPRRTGTHLSSKDWNICLLHRFRL